MRFADGRRDRLVAGLLMVGAAAAVVSGCRSSAIAVTGCKTDLDCGGLACVASVCVARDAPAGSWSIELVPPNDSTAATTEINGFAFDGSAVTWTTRGKVTITGNLGSGATINGASHVIATVPATIPGRPDLQFEGDWPASSKDKATQFMLSVPDSLLGMNAVMSVLPTPPDDSKQAPISVATKLTMDMWLTFPSDTLTVHGRLVSALLTPRKGFLARAFQGSLLVSNVGETQTDGTFSLTVPSGNVAGDPAHKITVELAPKDDTSADPRFISHEMALSATTDLGDLRLPASGDPNAFRFDVLSDSVSGAPVSGALVRARAGISGSPDGSADYSRSGLTDAQGSVNLSLLPGTADALRPYDITVIPPPNSAYGIACLPTFPLGTGGTAMAPALARKIALPPRAVIAGNLTSADQSAAANMTVVATRTDSGATGCSTAVAAPASVTSDKTGRYTLLLDPGIYRIDYDPPAGAAIPRLTESAVVVKGDARRDVTLPEASLVEGTVNGPDGLPVPSVVIHLFRIGCGGAGRPCTGPGRVEPLLRAVGRTDAKGVFRLIVPQGTDL
jgi:hypothetical protein